MLRGIKPSVQRGAGTSAAAAGASAQSVTGDTFAAAKASVAKRESTSASNLRKLLAVGGALLAGRAASASSRLACGFAEPTASPDARIVRTHASAK